MITTVYLVVLTVVNVRMFIASTGWWDTRPGRIPTIKNSGSRLMIACEYHDKVGQPWPGVSPAIWNYLFVRL
jgi:hypothetical protein